MRPKSKILPSLLKLTPVDSSIKARLNMPFETHRRQSGLSTTNLEQSQGEGFIDWESSTNTQPYSNQCAK